LLHDGGRLQPTCRRRGRAGARVCAGQPPALYILQIMFYREAPARRVGGVTALLIDCDRRCDEVGP
jgi:hypothetical protein